VNDTHPTPGFKQYIAIAVVLGLLTVIELWAANLTALKAPLLITLTIAKAVLVAMWYMHLKFDSRLFSAMFAGVIVVFAIPLTIILLSLI
jgi:cytochrome c oxidase subunit 4